MKNIIYSTKVWILAGLILVMSACEDFEEMNTDPNQPPVVPTSALLSSAQKQLMDHIWDEWHNGRFGMHYAQYWSANEYTDESRYQLRQAINNNYWLYYYAGRDALMDGETNGGGLQDLQEIIRLNENDPESFVSYGDTQNQIAVAKIMKAWMFQIITDIWGDVPYAEALQGSDQVAPAYTPQSEIYADLLDELTEANDLINLDAPGFTAGDLIYGGDMAKWQKFANALKMRVAIRMADVEPAAANAAINEALAAGAFESNEDNALLNYAASAPNNNPLNQDRKTRADFAVSEPLIDLMETYNDPRINYYAAPNANGEFVGLTYGLTQAEAGAIANSAVSQPSQLVLAPDAPGVFMDYAEVQFILAEAVARGFIGGSAENYYNQGIAASMEYWSNRGSYIPDPEISVNAPLNLAPISTAEIQDYYTNQAPYDPANWRQSIGEQKWLALYMQGIQGWTEWRRLDFTGVLSPPAAGPLVGDGIPLRITYPIDEQNRNRSSYEAAVSRQGADVLGTPMWWDVN
ncbi:SusD/RagB family nutrient-binding outer membrane lipoprotein [Catalinimonas niigatensis]|uniref:SusD/RagB family nutrient-binding outer membrane lipoprotein n=1 Tax=Catalinimonas niigatensis TaxID=1397264 RepID=UPI002667007E|nr:SusD/RagB family nutrient-binding outer membrane lipoprotein [Catalinimonas niigatensis]WPP49258.1 SusD/RagB family nutrient-binding outer membrane lipoprotein [Catalinimonas niigatensis]